MNLLSKKESTKKEFEPSIKISELINANYNLLWTIDRMGLGFGFGEDTVEEICNKRGTNTNTFLLICNVYSIDGYTPSKELLDNIDIRDIVRYLRRSHSYYLEVAVKYLEEALEKMLESCDDKHKNIIRQFFVGYKEELGKHFDYEETIVFPYIFGVLQSKDTGNYDIIQYEENHSNIEEKLNDLKNIVMKYLPDSCNSGSISNVLFYIYRLEEDLEKHTLIEDEILVPIVNKLEKKLKNNISR